MTDVIVRPEGPLARGSDRRASITVQPGGSAANQAAWLASFGVERRLRRPRVGAADVAKRDGAASRRSASHRISPAIPAHETGRLIALIDADGERSFLTDRGANEALEAGDIPDALIDGRGAHPSLRLFVLRSLRRARRCSMSCGAQETKPISVDPASAEFLREVGADNFLAWTRGAAILFPNEEEAAILAGSDDPETQCARLAALYPLVVVKRGAAGARGGGRRASAGESTRRRSRRSTPPARATPSSPLFWRRGLRD